MGSSFSSRAHKLNLASTIEIVDKNYAKKHLGVSCVKVKLNGKPSKIYYTKLNGL